MSPDAKPALLTPDPKPTSFTVDRVTGTLGAEISGIDLLTMDDSAVTELFDALVEHKVLFFRNQPMDTAQHIALARRFGPLDFHAFAALPSFHNLEDRPEVIVVESNAQVRGGTDIWHTDVTYQQAPSLGSILRVVVVPPVGGDTLWADMQAAYEGLDDATRSRISSMTAVHDWEGYRRMLVEKGTPADQIKHLVAQYPPSEHPVVRTHPVSGRKGLFVSRNFTTGIKGMKDEESRQLLDRLYALATVPDYQVRFRWKAGSIAFWDNRCTQHYVAADFYPARRRMERVTLAGDVPF